MLGGLRDESVVSVCRRLEGRDRKRGALSRMQLCLVKPSAVAGNDVPCSRLHRFRFFWGTTNMHWDLKDWGASDHTPVGLCPVIPAGRH